MNIVPSSISYCASVRVQYQGRIQIFHTKYPKKFSSLPPQLEIIWFFGVKSWFFTRNTPKIFAPPSARRNFFKCAPPLTWNPGSAPEYDTLRGTMFTNIHAITLLLYSNKYFFLRSVINTVKIWFFHISLLYSLSCTR